uniref:Mediator of RNA polymerase II transcription subunit 23 n=1 Tax=Rhodnius prolixus TaxID=13249 RepID=T1I0L3_RHOPR
MLIVWPAAGFEHNKFSYTLALAHAIWYHAGVGHLATLPQFVKEKLSPLIKTEEQLLFLCHLIGPFLHRFNTDRPKGVYELTIELYRCLEQVDKEVTQMNYMDPICDLLYPLLFRNMQNIIYFLFIISVIH